MEAENSFDMAVEADHMEMRNHSKKQVLEHLFFDYTATKQIWADSRLCLGMKKNMGSATAILKAYRSTYKETSTLAKMRYAAFASCIYHVWNARNKAIFENEILNVENVEE